MWLRTQTQRQMQTQMQTPRACVVLDEPCHVGGACLGGRRTVEGGSHTAAGHVARALPWKASEVPTWGSVRGWWRMLRGQTLWTLLWTLLWVLWPLAEKRQRWWPRRLGLRHHGLVGGSLPHRLPHLCAHRHPPDGARHCWAAERARHHRHQRMPLLCRHHHHHRCHHHHHHHQHHLRLALVATGCWTPSRPPLALRLRLVVVVVFQAP